MVAVAAPPIRISLVASTMLAGGAERQLALLANGWAARGHDVALVLLTGPDVPVYYPLDPLVRLEYLDSARDSWNAPGAVLNGVRRAERLSGALASLRSDIIVAVLPEAMIYSAIAAKRLRRPLLLSQVNNPAEDGLPRRWQVLRHVAFRAADAIVFQTQRAQAAAPPPFRARGVVIPNIVAAPNTPGAVSESRQIVAAGRLVPEKGFDVLLRAFALVRERHPDWKLTIWGEGPERRRLEALLHSLALDGGVELPGVTSEPVGWANGSSIFVLSSRTEGFPNVLCEAMASGHAVIASDCRFGPAEIIEPGVTGLLVPKEDPRAMADGVCSLIEDPDLRAAMGGRARVLVKRYSEDSVGNMWLDLIVRLVTGR